MFRPGGVELTRMMIEASGLPPGSKLMDVGCGDGGTVRFLRELGYDAAGIDAEIPKDCESRRGLPIRIGAASALPCRDSELDGVLCECVMSLIDRPETSLREFRRALRPGGALMISDVYSRAGGGRTSGYVKHVRALGEISRSVGGSGFSIERFEDCSRALESMAAQMMMDHGSEGLRGKYRIDCGEMRYLKSGYFWLVARAEERQG
ncbi:MAG: class I SAM-dependent methyltransferase [Synergistaceae bacterium]|jgi:SAM-dependent methyltransferase|nr:class I SAM-dependent methyltransferase [Synergistaceae bacterium]